MLIDWFTVVAQAINFLILVVLLRKFLYRPALQIIEDRQAEIARQLADAAKAKAAAESEREALGKEKAEFEGQRAALLDQVRTDASAERERLIAAAREDSETLKAKLRSEVEAENAADRQRLSLDIGRRSFEIAGKVLSEIASEDLNAQAAIVFANRLSDISEGEKASLQSAHGPLVIRSASPLNSATRARLEEALQAGLGVDRPVEYETDPSLVGGIDVVAGGYRLRWNLADRLASLAQQVDAAIRGPKEPAKS